MTAAALVGFACLTAGPPDGPDAEFARGAELRADAAAARPHFARAAGGYDAAWRTGNHAPALALNRARAHRLAGDLPWAVLALHEGLAVAPHDRDLQAALADVRSAVRYPPGEEPRPAVTLTSRLPPTDATVLAGGLWLVACLGVARFLMTRAARWLGFAGVTAVGLVALGGLWWADARARRDAKPLAVVTSDVVVRTGNGADYPPRLDAPLPRGAEVRLLGERGGWRHVELPGGAVGWVPGREVVGP